MTDIIARAKKLRTRLRALKPDDTLELPPADIDLLESGLSLLIDCYQAGKPLTEWMAQAQRTMRKAG